MRRLPGLLSMADLTIVIVSWNCRDDLAGCLRSIRSAASEIDSTVVVVDNGSTDGTVEMLRDDFTSTAVLANSTNRGFAAANNQALASLQSRYVLLLNPDTIVHKDALRLLVRFLDESPSIWAAGPLMLNRDGSRQISGVRFPNNWNILCETLFLDRLFPKSRIVGRHKELFADLSIPRSVDYVQGACLIVRADVLNVVGGLDEKFFMYFEETDWCYRMKHNGGLIYLFPEARVTHFGGGETGHYDETRLIHYHRSLLRFYRKHYSTWSSVIVKMIIALRSLVRLVGWCLIAVVRPGLRSSAASSMRGYIRTYPILFERVS